MGLVTQQDPIGIAGGLNLYGYANGDPVNYSDPFGLCVEDDVECEVILSQLRSIVSDYDLSDEARGEFDAAINYYDALQGDVEFVPRPEQATCCDNSNPATTFWAGGWRGQEGLGGLAYIRLNSALNPWDMALSAVHEAGHGLVPGPGGRGTPRSVSTPGTGLRRATHRVTGSCTSDRTPSPGSRVHSMKRLIGILVSCAAIGAACASVLVGEWQIVVSYNDATGDTVIVTGGSARLRLSNNSSFNADGPDDSVAGTYLVDSREEPGRGRVQFLELSEGVAFLGRDSLFITEVHGDSLLLTNPWTDSWSHLLRRFEP